MLKKLMLLAMAVTAIVAFAVPAVASAGWTEEEKPLEAPAEFEFTGPAQFTVSEGAAGAAATLHVKVNLTPGSTGHVTSFVATECKGLGALAGLVCDSTAQNLSSWAIHCSKGSLSITGVDIHNKYTPSGLAPDTTLTGSISAKPDNSLAISSVTLDEISAEANGSPAQVSGSLAVVGAAAKKYGCE
jgi:hypothetical protein